MLPVSESIAYVAQCIFVRGLTKDPELRLTGIGPQGFLDPRRDLVFEIAWKIAGDVLAGTSVDIRDGLALRNAIPRHPEYLQSAGRRAQWDGVA